MIKVIRTERLPIKMWVDDIEDEALEQAKHLANLPFSCKHVVLLADCHSGYGMPIGSVLATQGIIIPNAVGKDISCGVIATKTNINVEELSPELIKKIMGEIRNQVPMGLNGKHSYTPSTYNMPTLDKVMEISHSIIQREYENAHRSLGTCGSGNHFIELQKDSNNLLWIMIHSGSRNLGSKVADHYDKIAKKLNQKHFSQVPSSWDLAFLLIDTHEGKNYYEEMKYCIKYAQRNRDLMMMAVCNILETTLNGVSWDPSINISHNYAAYEHHFGENFIIHRKGATSANDGEIGIIPGSQGTKSYIVKGKGNQDSFKSTSHGAGRMMSRTKARATLSLEDEQRILNDQGIIHGIRSAKDLDEAPSAYKDICVVMENQKDLVDIVEELRPIAVMKG